MPAHAGHLAPPVCSATATPDMLAYRADYARFRLGRSRGASGECPRAEPRMEPLPSAFRELISGLDADSFSRFQTYRAAYMRRRLASSTRDAPRKPVPTKVRGAVPNVRVRAPRLAAARRAARGASSRPCSFQGLSLRQLAVASLIYSGASVTATRPASPHTRAGLVKPSGPKDFDPVVSAQAGVTDLELLRGGMAAPPKARPRIMRAPRQQTRMVQPPAAGLASAAVAPPLSTASAVAPPRARTPRNPTPAPVAATVLAVTEPQADFAAVQGPVAISATASLSPGFALGWLATIGAFMDHQLRHYTQRTNAVMSALLTGTGELLVQALTGAPLDLNRALRVSTISGFLAAFGTYYWYKWVDRVTPSIVPKHYAGNKAKIAHVTTKVAMEEVLWNPIFNSVYLLGIPLVMGHGLSTALTSWSDRFISVTLANLCVWPLLNLLNYSPAMPTHLRQLVVAVETLVWMAYLCLRMRS